MTITDILDRAESLLQGEPLRFIAYGSAAIIYLAAKALGSIPDQSFPDAVIAATAGAATLVTIVESIRRFVSPAFKVEEDVPQVIVGEEP